MKIDYKIELDPVSFIAGDYQEFEYNVVDSASGMTVSLNENQIASAKVAFCSYGDFESPVLVIEAAREDMSGGSFLIRLESSDTEGLSGLYVQQPIITDVDGMVFRPGQGTVNIYPRIHSN